MVKPTSEMDRTPGAGTGRTDDHAIVRTRVQPGDQQTLSGARTHPLSRCGLCGMCSTVEVANKQLTEVKTWCTTAGRSAADGQLVQR